MIFKNINNSHKHIKKHVHGGDESDVYFPGRRGVTLGKPDIKVETINKETHSLEEDSGSVSTATRMVKAMYSVSTFDNTHSNNWRM